MWSGHSQVLSRFLHTLLMFIHETRAIEQEKLFSSQRYNITVKKQLRIKVWCNNYPYTFATKLHFAFLLTLGPPLNTYSVFQCYHGLAGNFLMLPYSRCVLSFHPPLHKKCPKCLKWVFISNAQTMSEWNAPPPQKKYIYHGRRSHSQFFSTIL